MAEQIDLSSPRHSKPTFLKRFTKRTASIVTGRVKKTGTKKLNKKLIRCREKSNEQDLIE